MDVETLFEGNGLDRCAYQVVLHRRHKYSDSTDGELDFDLISKNTGRRVAYAETALRGNVLKIDWIRNLSAKGVGLGSVLLDAILRTARKERIFIVYGWTSAIKNSPAELVELHEFYERFSAMFYYDDIGGHFLIKL